MQQILILALYIIGSALSYRMLNGGVDNKRTNLFNSLFSWFTVLMVIRYSEDEPKRRRYDNRRRN